MSFLAFYHPFLADIIWPALFLVSRLVAVVPLGLLIEFVFLWKFLKINAREALIIDVLMNLTSTLLGFILIPLFGLIVVIPFPATFGTGAWIATFILAVLINALLESLVVKRWLKRKFTGWDFWLLFFANALSVGLAFATFIIYPT